SYHSKTRILLSDGSEKEIGALVDSLMESRKQDVIQGKDCEILPLKPSEIELFSSDFCDVFKTSVDRISRHKAPDRFVRITLQNGRSVCVTPEHPCWVIADGKISTKPAEQVTGEDFLPIPTMIPLNGVPQAIERKPQPVEMKIQDKRENKNLQAGCFPSHNDADFCKLIGYLITDGGYEINRGKKVGVNFTNKDAQLITDFCSLAKKYFGIDPYVRTRPDGVAMARISSKALLDYLCGLDACFAKKSEHKRIPPFLMKSTTADLRQMLSAMFECDGWATQNRVGFVSPNLECCEQVQTLLLRFGIPSSLLAQKTEAGKNIWRVTITGAENLRMFYGRISFLSERKNNRLAAQLNPESYRTIKDVVPNMGASVARLSATLKVDESKVLDYPITPFKSGKQNFSRPALKKFAEAFEQKLDAFEKARKKLPGAESAQTLKAIRTSLNISLADLEQYAGASHQTLSSIECGNIERKNKSTEILRDALEKFCVNAQRVSGEVAFLKRLAFGQVAWSKVKKVEAVANETEEWVYDVTVEPTRSFISECMLLHNTISVAKAGIVTTFKSKTSILAAANPKLGRFDPNTPPAQQFDIPPTLMSRFDLIFAIKDVLDEAKDRKLVDHVLTGHMFAAKKQKLSDLKDSPIIPPIMPNMLRKYISYARKNIHPVLTDEAANRIKDYYLSLRRMGAQQNTFPVTAREIEGLIRMSEASAKLRLSNSVDLRDAERAIALVHFVLSDIFMDKETGKIDSDIISTGQPKSKVDKMRSILGIINALEQKLDIVDIDEIVAQAQTIGMDETIARRLIDELKRNGDLYEPKVGFVKSSRSR
ncbi:MAG: LAGLIDADG family homing endonuclease, partial [Candidatus Micrarchaeia archaeon]